MNATEIGHDILCFKLSITVRVSTHDSARTLLR